MTAFYGKSIPDLLAEVAERRDAIERAGDKVVVLWPRRPPSGLILFDEASELTPAAFELLKPKT